jgi:predicted cupin superfamily sugar epimerase
MKKLLPLLIIVNLSAFGQCEDRNSAGSASIHYSGGYGVELGQQGMLNNTSFFLGIDLQKTQGFKGDSTVSFLYGKIVQRFLQSADERFEVGVSIAPGFSNTDFDFAGGVRALYVVGKNAAVSIEPSYRMSRGIGGYVSVHFLL